MLRQDRARHLPATRRFFNLNPETGGFQTTYEDTCEWGGTSYVKADYLDGEYSYSATDTASIRFDYLVQLSQYPSLVDTGETDFHPFNHFIDTDIEYMVPLIIERFYFKLDSAGLGPPFPLVYMNDISLPFGGRFAIRSWTDRRHNEHRQGANADMYYENWDYESLRWQLMLSAILSATGITPLHDPVHHNNHFHVFFPTRPWTD